FSSGENVAPPTRVVAMNCSIVYCLTGTGLSGLGLGVCAKSEEGAKAAARTIVLFMFALVALQFRVFNIFSISACRRFPSDFQNFARRVVSGNSADRSATKRARPAQKNIFPFRLNSPLADLILVNRKWPSR